MNIQEALDKKIKKIRLPQWNNKAYLELPIFDDGTIGPWAKLHDPHATKEPIPILLFTLLTSEETNLYELYEESS